MPGITVYVVKNGDSYVGYCERFYTTVEEICELNELEEDRVVPGMPLLFGEEGGRVRLLSVCCIYWRKPFQTCSGHGVGQ